MCDFRPVEFQRPLSDGDLASSDSGQDEPKSETRSGADHDADDADDIYIPVQPETVSNHIDPHPTYRQD